MLAVDLSQVPQAVRVKIEQLFREDHAVRLVRAMQEQQRMAAEFERNRPRSSNGLGEQTMALHPYIDACNRAIVGSHRWSNDKDLRKWYLKRFPEARVRSTGTKTQVGYVAQGAEKASSRAGHIVVVGSGAKRSIQVYA